MKKQTKRFYSKFGMENLDNLNVADIEKVIDYLDRGDVNKIRCVFGIQSKSNLRSIVKKASQLSYFRMSHARYAHYLQQINHCSALA